MPVIASIRSLGWGWLPLPSPLLPHRDAVTNYTGVRLSSASGCGTQQHQGAVASYLRLSVTLANRKRDGPCEGREGISPGYDTPPAPSREGKSYSPVIKERFISLQCNLFTDMAGFSFAIFFHNFIFVV